MVDDAVAAAATAAASVGVVVTNHSHNSNSNSNSNSSNTTTTTTTTTTTYTTTSNNKRTRETEDDDDNDNERQELLNVSDLGSSDNIVTTTTITATTTTTKSTKKKRRWASTIKEYFQQFRPSRPNDDVCGGGVSCVTGGSTTATTKAALAAPVVSEADSIHYVLRPEWSPTPLMSMLLIARHHLRRRRSAGGGGSYSSRSHDGIDEEDVIVIPRLDDADLVQLLFRKSNDNHQQQQQQQQQQQEMDGTHDADRTNENPKMMDRINTFLRSYSICYDADKCMWKLKERNNWVHLGSAATAGATADGSSHPTDTTVTNENKTTTTTTATLEEDILEVSYQALAQQCYVVAEPRTFGKDKDTILHMAIREHNTRAAIEIIRVEYNTLCDMVGSSSLPPWRTAPDGSERTLLEMTNRKGVTPLMIAAQKGNLTIVQELLWQCGVNVSRTADNGATALLQAAHFGHATVVECIIQHYNKVTININNHSSELYISLIDFMDAPNMNQTTALMRASQEGHVSTVRLLLQYGASVHHRNSAHMTPLMLAAQRGHATICQLLLNYRANVDARTTNPNRSMPHKSPSCALSLACRRGHVAVVKTLVRAGCELYFTDDRNRTVADLIRRRIQRHYEMTTTTTTTPAALAAAALNAAAAVVNHVAAAGVAPILNQPRNHHRNNPNNRRRPIYRRNRNGNYRRNENDDIDGGGNINNDDDDDDDDDDNMSASLIHGDERILPMLNIESQVQMMKLLAREERNYEIIRMYTLLQRNRASVHFAGVVDGSDDMFSDVPTVVRCLTNLSTTKRMSPAVYAPDWLFDISIHALLRTMLLPAPLIQTIALFLPLANVWDTRLRHLRLSTSQINPNVTIVCALDIIDEIIEEGGFLSACDLARIPAPNPHGTWCDWKRCPNVPTTTTMPYPLSSDRDSALTRNVSNIHIDTAVTRQRQLNVTVSTPPRPHDENNPTPYELRRLVGYLPLLNMYQFETNIVSILYRPPYNMPLPMIQKLICIADIASVCRRCCMERFVESASTAVPPPPPPPLNGPAVGPPQNNNNHGINNTIRSPTNPIITFDASVAIDIISLADSLRIWYSRERHINTTTTATDRP